MGTNARKGARERPAATGGRVIGLGLLIVLCMAAPACQMETDSASLKELREGQKEILKRIEKIEKAQQDLLSAWQARFPKRPTVDYNKVYDIKIGKSPVRGAKDAKVTLVEFSDFQCPYSQRVQSLIQKLLADFPNDLRHVFKNFPLRFHKRAMPAAKACLAAHMQGKFWEMEELLFKHQKQLEDEDLRKYAKQIGLDMDRFEKDFQGKEVQQRIEQDIAEARRVRVTGTPTLFLNGKRVRYRSEEAMKKQIEAILKGQKTS